MLSLAKLQFLGILRHIHDKSHRISWDFFVFFLFCEEETKHNKKKKKVETSCSVHSAAAASSSQYICSITTAVAFPVVPHKAVAEVSRIGHYRRGELL